MKFCISCSTVLEELAAQLSSSREMYCGNTTPGNSVLVKNESARKNLTPCKMVPYPNTEKNLTLAKPRSGPELAARMVGKCNTGEKI